MYSSRSGCGDVHGRSGISDGGAVGTYCAWCIKIDNVGFGGESVDDGAGGQGGSNVQVVSMAAMASGSHQVVAEQVEATAAMLLVRAVAKAADLLVLKELETAQKKDWASVVSI